MWGDLLHASGQPKPSGGTKFLSSCSTTFQVSHSFIVTKHVNHQSSEGCLKVTAHQPATICKPESHKHAHILDISFLFKIPFFKLRDIVVVPTYLSFSLIHTFLERVVCFSWQYFLMAYFLFPFFFFLKILCIYLRERE